MVADFSRIRVEGEHADDQLDQKKSPNVYKSCPKRISLEK